MTEKIPESVWSGTLTIMGVELVVHVLEDGRRIFEAEGVAALFKAMETGTLHPDEVEALAEALRQ